MDAAGGQQPAPEAEPPRRVVVATDQHHLRARGPQPHQRVLAQVHRAQRRDGPVVDVTGDGDHLDTFAAHDIDQMVEERLLRRPEVGLVQRPAQMPVGGVQQPHRLTVRRPSDGIVMPLRGGPACLGPPHAGLLRRIAAVGALLPRRASDWPSSP